MLIKIPIRIHCWGGLGSQLYAWALFERLSIRFPKRKLRLVLHTGGVTRRVSNLNSLFDEVELTTVDDFENLEKLGNRFSYEKNREVKTLSNWIVKFLLQFKSAFDGFGFITSCDSEDSVASIKPWTVSIRGHYSNLVIDFEILSAMMSRAKIYNFKDLEIDANWDIGSALHYRLGDLLTLSAKSPIQAERVASCIMKLNNRDMVIISDSPEVARSLLTKFASDVEFRTLDLPIWEAINFLCSVQIFVGTPSKISEWVAIFRIYFSYENRKTFLPVEMKSQMNQILSVELKTEQLSYY